MFDVFASLVDCGRWSLTMYKSWFHMKLIINSYVMGKGGTKLGILILSNTNAGSMFTTFRGGSRGGILSHGWISHFCTPFSNASAH